MPLQRSSFTRVVAVAALMPAVALVAACGGGGSPEGAYESFLSALINGDAQAACELAANEDDTVPPSADAISGCLSDIGSLLAAASEKSGESVEVDTATVTGEIASIPDQSVRIGGEVPSDSDPSPARLKRLDGNWYVIDLG